MTDQQTPVFNDPEYVGQQVQIGSGFLGIKPLAQAGFIVINDGTLYLLKSDESVIASAPLSECSVGHNALTRLTFGQTVLVTVSGTPFSVAVNHSVLGVAIPSLGVLNQRRGTRGFVDAFRALAGQQATP